VLLSTVAFVSFNFSSRATELVFGERDSIIDGVTVFVRTVAVFVVVIFTRRRRRRMKQRARLTLQFPASARVIAFLLFASAAKRTRNNVLVV
jgi:hypothetical protein